MTSTAHPAAFSLLGGHAAPRDALAARSLRESVSAMVRRRVPANDVEDVAQTILCDALAAPILPTDPEDLRRFVVGIARHKVADFHRGTRRRNERAESGEHLEPTAPPPPVEARDLLTNIAASVATNVREQETLEWLVREHAGEQLQNIAADAGLPAPAVRQRVSRLRRVLRAQWAQALALLLIAGGCVALTERAHRDRLGIAPDPTGDPIARAALLVEGRWRIEVLSTADAAAANGVEAKVVDVRVIGRRVDVAGPVHTSSRTISAFTPLADGTIAVTLSDDHGSSQHATAKVTGNRMQLVVHDGALRGSAVLVRY